MLNYVDRKAAGKEKGFGLKNVGKFKVLQKGWWCLSRKAGNGLRQRRGRDFQWGN